jgi:hypothetical protein
VLRRHVTCLAMTCRLSASTVEVKFFCSTHAEVLDEVF